MCTGVYTFPFLSRQSPIVLSSDANYHETVILVDILSYSLGDLFDAHPRVDKPSGFEVMPPKAARLDGIVDGG